MSTKSGEKVEKVKQGFVMDDDESEAPRVRTRAEIMARHGLDDEHTKQGDDLVAQLGDKINPGQGTTTPVLQGVALTPTVAPPALSAPAFELADSAATSAEQLAHYEMTIAQAHMLLAATLQATHEYWILTAGRALREIREHDLPGKEGYASFEAYVQGRWGFSRSYAYRLIDAVPVVQALTGVANTELNERQVRAIAPVVREHGDDAAREVWLEAERRGRTSGAGLTAARTWLGYGVADDEASDSPPATEQQTPAAISRFQRATRLIDVDGIRQAAHDNPGAVKQVVTELRELLAAIETSLTEEPNRSS